MKSILMFLYALLLGFFSAFVGLQLYTWFVFPITAFTLTYWHFYGLMVCKGYLLYRYKPENQSEHGKVVANATVFVLLAWAMGAFANWMM